MPEVEFNAERHEYAHAGRPVRFSVTRVIEAGGLSPKFDGVDPFYRDRGTAVHKATEYEERRTLDERNLDSQISPYLKGYRAWKVDVRPVVLAVEKRVYHPGLEYAGTIDRIVEVCGVKGVVDVKTGHKYPWHQIQTAAYAMAENGKNPQTLKRWSLYLDERGRYKFVEHTDFGDFLVWQSCLTIAKWKARFGLE